MDPFEQHSALTALQGASKLNMHPRVPEQPAKGLPRQVVYAPACVTRMMGPASGDSEKASVHEKLLSLFDKAGYEVIYPEVSCNAPCLGTQLRHFSPHPDCIILLA